jgi:hypothetical protein
VIRSPHLQKAVDVHAKRRVARAFVFGMGATRLVARDVQFTAECERH